ncbi:MAG: hypothetical protein HXY44_11770 [Syntrophaceae bacterium]|nr:hypothetical protein [Syntrophaceae bacterium]
MTIKHYSGVVKSLRTVTSTESGVQNDVSKQDYRFRMGDEIEEINIFLNF